MQRISVNKIVLLLFLAVISVVFLSMTKHFIIAVLFAGIFSAMVHPIYCRFLKWFRGLETLSALITLLLILIAILLPMLGLIGIITAQAIKVSYAVTPLVQKQISEPESISRFFSSLPFYQYFEPYKETIIQKVGELLGTISTFIVNSLSSVTVMTVNFIFLLFVMLYTMYFFLKDGPNILARILYYIPLEDRDEKKMLSKFTSVTRATLKGTAVIGILQGALAGLAFAVIGIDSAVFWGTIMTVLSIIPGVGTGLVWIPACIILAASGSYAKAIGLAAFCALIVGSVDNLLRPILVGRDTEMHELLIFFSTLGGIAMFGLLGFIIGPIIAALFVTVWEIYGEVFKEYLPTVGLHKKVKTDGEKPN